MTEENLQGKDTPPVEEWVAQFDAIDFSEFTREKDTVKYVMMTDEKIKSFIRELLAKEREVAYRRGWDNGSRDSLILKEARAAALREVLEMVEKEKIAGSLPNLNSDEIYHNDILDNLLTNITNLLNKHE